MSLVNLNIGKADNMISYISYNNCCEQPRTTDTHWQLFFKYHKYFGRLGRSAKDFMRYSRVFLVVLIAQISSLYIPSSWFCITKLFLFYKKLQIDYIL